MAMTCGLYEGSRSSLQKLGRIGLGKQLGFKSSPGDMPR